MSAQRSLVLAVLATSAAVAAQDALAGDEEVKKLITPVSEVEIGAGAVLGRADRAGRYNGLNEAGPFGILNGEVVQRDEETGTWIRLNGTNLGLDNRDNRFEHERPALPALALAPDSVTLSALAQDNRLTESFSRPFLAFAQPGDVLVVLSATATAANILAIVQAAHERGCPVIAITGASGGDVARLLAPEDVLIQIPEHRAYRVHEAQLFTLHCCCALIDASLFGDPDLV